MDRIPDNIQSPDSDIEAQLQAVPLARPSRMLEARIRETIERRMSQLRRRWIAAAVAAIVIAVATTFSTLKRGALSPRIIATGSPQSVVSLDPNDRHRLPRQDNRVSVSDSQSPIRQRERIVRTLSAYSDDGIVATVGGQPIDCLRQVQVDEVVVFDPQRGSTVVYRRPRERLILVNPKTY